MAKVSIIIPTRNRKESLIRTLLSIRHQMENVLEILVVDASDSPLNEEELTRITELKLIRVILATASVCKQRNTGIREAKGEFLFFLDDDIEVNHDYIRILSTFLETESKAMVTTGLVYEKDKAGVWQCSVPPKSSFQLLWTWIFQLGLWGDPSSSIAPAKWNTQLITWYKKRGNSLSKAGWPQLSDFAGPCFRTPIYGLGASMARKSWMVAHEYEENLGAHGIGDNYGVAIQLKKEEGIFVQVNAKALHAKTPVNRLQEHQSYTKRVLALNYFSVHNNTGSMWWLAWSLFGNFLGALAGFRGKFAWINFKLIFTVLFKQNPLLTENKKAALRL